MFWQAKTDLICIFLRCEYINRHVRSQHNSNKCSMEGVERMIFVLEISFSFIYHILTLYGDF